MTSMHALTSGRLAAIMILATQLLLPGASEAVVPGETNFQGLLLDAGGQPLNGAVDLELRLYDALTGGTLLWSETHVGVQVVDGVYDVAMGATMPIPDAVFETGSLHLEVQVGSETLSPRRPLLAVPYARRARDAEAVDGLSGTFVTQLYEHFDFDGGDPPNDDPREGLGDSDGDGAANFIDPDNDGDGLADTEELAQGSDINLSTPVISGFDPVALTVSDTAALLPLEVQGSSFVPGLTCQVGAQSPVPQSVTGTTFDVTVGAEPEGFATATVTLPNGESDSAQLEFVYPVPTITGFDPVVAIPTATTLVTVQGTNFFPGLAVVFGSESPTPMNLTPTSFDVQVGPQPAGPATVTVTLANGKNVSTGYFFAESKTVFITSSTFTGYLGGLAGADASCASAASNAGLSGTFLAWIGDNTGPIGGDPLSRFAGNGAWLRTDGVLVAVDFDNLIDGSIDAPIDRDEFGAQVVTVTRAWTNVNGYTGTALNTFDCGYWTIGSPTPGKTGSAISTTATWTQGEFVYCNDFARLYCFEQ